MKILGQMSPYLCGECGQVLYFHDSKRVTEDDPYAISSCMNSSCTRYGKRVKVPAQIIDCDEVTE